MHPLLSQIQNIIQGYYPDTRTAMSDDTRLAILKALLPVCSQIPPPGSGDTLLRWQILAYVAGQDLPLVKWLESHLDAISILQEIGYAEFYLKQPNKLWAVWAAEGHPTPVHFSPDVSGTALSENPPPQNMTVGTCNGVKTWCSGANVVDFGLMTYRDAQNQSQLIIIDMLQSDTIHIDNSSWQAVGMQATDTATLTFTHTPATQIGDPASYGKNYLNRAGFWYGGAGVAACWYGTTVAIADYLRHSYRKKPHPFKAMYLGQISTQLAVTQQYFYHVADLIDNTPTGNHVLAIRQLRHQVEATARHVVEQVGQALGAAPFCQNAHFAKLAADLTVFIRQSHGAFDSQAIGELVADFSTEMADNEQKNLWQL